MIGYFLLEGKSSRDYGIYISGSGTYDAPERDVSTVEIPGRNGNLLIDNGRFKNTSLKYPAFVRKHFKTRTDGAKRWLLKNAGYRRLEDSYHPDEFRLARFAGPLEFDMKFLNRSGECELIFDCKPQRFLKSGEVWESVTGPITLYNPTGFPALPLIRVYGTAGILIVGNIQVRIDAIDGYLDLDCDTQNALKGTKNCNGDIYAPDFPVLPEGTTGVSFSGGITRIEIQPRWWKL